MKLDLSEWKTLFLDGAARETRRAHLSTYSRAHDPQSSRCIIREGPDRAGWCALAHRFANAHPRCGRSCTFVEPHPRSDEPESSGLDRKQNTPSRRDDHPFSQRPRHAIDEAARSSAYSVARPADPPSLALDP